MPCSGQTDVVAAGKDYFVNLAKQAPGWGDVGKAGQKDVILWKTMYGHKATGPFGTLYIGPENYDKLDALNNLRIPLSKISDVV